MEHSGISSAMYAGIGSGMLGLEIPLQQQQQQTQPEHNPHHLHHPQMVAYAHHDPNDHHLQSHQQSVKQGYQSIVPTKAKQQSPLSDEDEHGFGGDDSTSDGKRKISPWQRMKWTDNMVRLLIMAVYYIGDEVGSDGNDPIGKKKAGGLSQKKGKWKSVSRAMMEKGFYVSPQQCEDKFNDLNKRYKRVNDILGKGVACKVVENQSLLDSMELSSKMKEEVRKLLNSKHLFFREMCAYHNSCGHSTTTVASGANHSTDVAADQSHGQHPHVANQQQQRCSHSSENAHIAIHSRTETEGSKMAKRVGNEDDDESDDGSDDDEDEEEDGEDEERGRNGHESEEDEHENEDKSSRKRPRNKGITSASALMQQLTGELTSMFQDGAKSPWEKKQWIKLRLLQLEEQQVSYLCESFELEKQRVKWVKFSGKKEREMERAKLENERRRLENERMVLIIKQKELEFLDLHHHQQQQMSSNKRSDPSSITG